MQATLIATLLHLIGKLLGAKTLAKVTIASLRAWSKTTDTEWDDKVTEAFAEAWEVPPDDLKDFLK